MASLITRVKSKLFIHSSTKSAHQLDGAYASLLHGRSHDFEDLRAYEFGDQVRDIDWRATARQGEPLVKRHRANRMHTILFVVDTGRAMTALAHDEKPKRELAVLVTGALGILALRHGDDVAVVHGDAAGIRRRPSARSESALEHALRGLDGAISASEAPSDRDALLDHVARTIARRMIVVIVTDEEPVTDTTEQHLRRLRVQHDVLWVTLRDADPVLDHTTRRMREDVTSRWAVPDFVHGDAEVLRELTAQAEADAARLSRVLDRLEISHTAIDAQDDAIPALLAMLNRRAHVRA